MRVLFVNPNPYRPAVPPVGLEYVAEATREAGHEVTIFDTAIEDVALLPARVRAWRPDAIGLTLRNLDTGHFFNSVGYVKPTAALIASLRRVFAGPIIVGGAAFTLAPALVLAALGADYGVVGEGEGVLPRLLEHLDDPASVPNVVYRDRNDGTVRATERRFDWRPTLRPRRDLVDHAAYYRVYGRFPMHSMANVQTARGCDHHCTYCAEPRVIGRNLIARPVDDVVDELAQFAARGITERFFLVDSEFNVSAEHAAAVCEAILRRGLRIQWGAYLIPDRADRALIQLMDRAGCKDMVWTMESASDRVLKGLGKSHRTDDVVRVGRTCGELGLRPIILLMFGGPGESADTVRETWQRVHDLPGAVFGIGTGVRIYPSTPLARLAQREGEFVHDAELLEPVYYRPALVRDELYPAVMRHFGDMPNAIVLGPDRKTKHDAALAG